MLITRLAAGTNLNRVVNHITSCVIKSVGMTHGAETMPSTPVANERRSKCVEVLIQLLSSGCLDALSKVEMQRELLSALVSLPHELLVSGGGNGDGLWKPLLDLLVPLNRGQNLR